MSPLNTDVPPASLISMLCGVPASALSKAIVNAWPAGALSVVGSNAMFSALIVTTGPLGDAAAPDADAPGTADDLKASLQQSGKGVLFGAGLKFGSRQPVNVVTRPLESKTGSL